MVSLGACSSDPQPKTLPPLESTSSSPSVSPSATVPEIPPAAKEKTAEGASAFASYYLDLVGRSFESADATALRALTSDACGGCQALIDDIEALRSQKRRRQGGGYEVSAAVSPALETEVAIVDIRYSRSAANIVDTMGAVVASAPPVAAQDAQLQVEFGIAGWTATGYRIVGAS